MPAVPVPFIVGREAELRLLGTSIRQVASGGSATVIVGDAGIGKSTLLSAAAELAHESGLRVLSTTGVESESRLPFTGLRQLLLPVMGSADSLPPAQRRALRSALGVPARPEASDSPDAGAVPGPFLIALATLNLLTEAASECPLLVAVDDAQWLDPASQDALAFVARRVQGDPVVVVVATRVDPRGPFLTSGLPELALAGLDGGSARAVLRLHAGDLSVGDREHILRESLGNPLALVELPLAWRATQDEARRPALDPMPLNQRLEAAFADRGADLPPTSRDILLVAAVDAEGDASEILAAASALAGGRPAADALTPALDAGLLRFDGGRLTFRHPLVRSAVQQAEPPVRHRAAHAALADVLPDQPYRRTWHRAQAIEGLDDEVADELETSHRTALRRGSPLSAVRALERSAQLTTDPARRVRRLLLAAEQAFDMGRADLVDRLLTATSSLPLTLLDRARRAWLQEIFSDGVPGDARRVDDLCDNAEQAAAAGEPDLALNLLLGAGLRCWWADAGPDASARVVRVVEGLRGVADDPRRVAALAVAEPVRHGRTVMEDLSRIPLHQVTDPNALRLFGIAAHAVGDQVRSAELLRRSADQLRRQGKLGLLPHVLGILCRIGLDCGYWDRVAENATEGLRITEETGQPMWTTGMLTNSSWALGLRGDTEQALHYAAEAEASMEHDGLNNLLACVQLGRGYGLTAAGRYAEAYEALRRLFDPKDPAYHQRECFSGLMFLAEAALHVDRREEARAVLARMEQVARVTPAPLLHVHLLYTRAVLADDADAESLYLAGLAADLSRWPWVRARIQHAYGSWLRRRRRTAESREQLRSAHSAFELCGATTWAEQAGAELRASGERPDAPVQAAVQLLSVQELQIARLAAEGLSNRQIGEQLFLSHRTVGSHLYRVFPKLQITSRSQLAARLSTDRS